MAQALPSRSSLHVLKAVGALSVILLHLSLADLSVAQTPQQQYVFNSVPVTAGTSQMAGYAKNGQSGALSAVVGSPFADTLQGGAMAIDGLGRFLFVLNPATNNISMFQIDQSTGKLSEVPGSPFSTGPTENPSLAAKSPICLATEKSGQFLYVGYRFGNIVNQGAINEYLIDANSRQLVSLSGQPTTDIASSPIGMVSDAKGVHLYVGLGQNVSTGLQQAGTNVYSIDPVTGTLGLVGTAGNAISAGRSIAIDPKSRFFFDGWGTTSGMIDSALISPADGTALTGISTVASANGIPAAMLTDGSGKFLYVQEGLTSVVYAIDQTSGALAVPPTGLAVLAFSTGSAAADPLGPYLYSSQKDGVHGFLVNPQTGALSEVPGSPFGGAFAQGTLAISGAPVQAASGPVAALFPASQDFGSITVGHSGVSKLITLTNTGGQALSLTSISVTGNDPSDFVPTPNCSIPAVISPNASCTVSLVFSPTAAGARQASLAAVDNAPGSPQTISLTGTGVAALPGVTLVPGSLAFATTNQGSTSPPQTITLTNAGSAVLHISSVLPGGSNPGDFQVTNACSGVVLTGSTCNIVVAFSPLGAGQRSANLTISDDAPDTPQTVQLTGTGAPLPPGTPALKLAPSSLSFGTVTQGAIIAAQIITVTNSGAGPLHISSVALGGTNSSDFSLTNSCTAPSYAVGATCTMSLSFSPMIVGARSATIAIASDTLNSPQTVAIAASVNPAFAISPAAPGSTSVTVVAGQTAAFNLQLTAGPGFAGSATFICSGTPAAATCAAPGIPITGGPPVSYVVSVSTTKNTLILWRPQLPPFVWLRLFSLLALCGFGVLFLHIRKLRRFGFTAGALRAAAVTLLAALGVLQAAGCGGGSRAAAPQSAPPTPHTIGTPQGTSIITLTPSAMTSSGIPLSGIAPIQLTLTVQ